MDKFKASNGVRITLTNAGKTGYCLIYPVDEPTSGYLSFKEMVAWREFFRAERDEELGRWRVPGQPNIVVYPVDDGSKVRVFDESQAYLSQQLGREVLTAEAHPTSAFGNARAYFEAHPEPKPWHDAKEGEVWVIEYNGNEYPAIFQADAFRDHGGSWTADSITAARRIYPVEEAS